MGFLGPSKVNQADPARITDGRSKLRPEEEEEEEKRRVTSE